MSGLTKNFIFSIPGDLHLISQLRLNRAAEFRAYFDEAERLAKDILSCDKFFMQHGKKPVRSNALNRMKRIAFVIRGVCEAGRRALKQRKKNEALTHAYRIFDFRAEIFSEPDREHGELQAKNLSEAGKENARAFRDKHIIWQHQAEEIWQEWPNYGISRVARKIARETGNKWETIRKVIKKNKKTVEG